MKKLIKSLSIKNVSSDTWVRTIVLIVALINQGLIIFGKTSKLIDENSVASTASYILTIVSALWAWWKNNSFTEKAQNADADLKSGKNSVG